ncbi:hypothetical protein VOLCADRAFT_102690 [Volvox carteri f. nagariensis]|uniref:Protein YIP n=1 Tax=Volvox carteri f. nagariensis TaxID=3068 RepID=D8THG1_VOLCA|nr:uncharacterized protein VOLCADRAFT_102690 [Volvox carteri f. nagariensis]EFJ53065.1 hypothetical protein VOLCADRAFT_102690 [Volvox carteri f. nagariensis]|eukprot:XP_002946070.1 hypothetical protein VOLCADRAFT_102690 [Volvox carteri f. nagariensis]
MQGAGPPGGHNPFGPASQGAYPAYNVNTTAQFADEVMPAAPQGPPPSASFAPVQQGAWGPPAPPGAGYGPQHVALQFTDTTAPQYVAGNIQRQEERQILDGGPGGSASASTPKEDYTKYPFYNVRRYREYFDVDTKDVLWRVGNSMIGAFRPNFMEVTMKNPDLILNTTTRLILGRLSRYGPFWTATTLIFVTAVVGNFVDYIEWRRGTGTSSPPPPSPLMSSSPPPTALSNGAGRLLLSSSDTDFTKNQWFTDYTKLATSAAIFYGYIFIVGLVLFFIVKWFKGELRLANVFCIYGYCMTIYIPVSIACIVPYDWARWVMVMTATALSAGFLFMNFRATIYSAAPARAVLVLLLIVLAHIALGLGLKLYFFQY